MGRKKTVNRRIEVCKDWLAHLLSKPKLNFDRTLNMLLPKEAGVYHIAVKDVEEGSLYVGGTDNLRARVLRDHFGRRNSSLKKKLIKSKKIRSDKRAKEYLQSRCYVQYVLIGDKRFRKLVKHFVISVLNPELND